MNREEEVKQRYERVATELNERTRRLLAASEALAIGWGGVSMVSRATGLSRPVISQGIKELQQGAKVGEGRIRRKGGGRKSNVSKDPGLSEDLERLVEPVTRGDTQSPLRWTSKSVRKLAKELQHLGHQVSHELVSELLHGLGYSLQALRKKRRSFPQGNRSCRWTRKRRNWWVILRTRGGNGTYREKLRTCGSTISPSKVWGEQRPMGCTTWGATRAG